MLTLVESFFIATVGKQIPSSTCFLTETLNLEKISGCLLQNCLKLAINLSIDIREGKRDWKHQYIIYGKLAFNSCYSCIENFNACLWGVCELHVLTACI